MARPKGSKNKPTRKPKETDPKGYEQYFDMTIAAYPWKLQRQGLKTYYTKVMNGIKNAKGKLVEMAPEEFLKHGFVGKDMDDTGAKDILKKNMAKFADPNWSWSVPVIDVTRGIRLGAFRVACAKEVGLSVVPVLLVGITEEAIDKWVKATGVKVKSI